MAIAASPKLNPNRRHRALPEEYLLVCLRARSCAMVSLHGDALFLSTHGKVNMARIRISVVFQKWRWTAMNVTLGFIFVASLRKEWPMTFIAVQCPHCQSDQIVKRGKTARGTQRGCVANFVQEVVKGQLPLSVGRL